MPEPASSAPLRALLSRILDYAGLFPPAKLDMPATVRNYAAYANGPDEWMLARLIIPVARLDEFETHAAALLPRGRSARPWRLSALTAPAAASERDLDSLRADLERIDAFNKHHATPAHGAAVIDVIELKAAAPDAIDAALDIIPDDLRPFFEIPLDNDPRGLITALSGEDAGAKARTGGLTPDLFPSPAHLARFIHACAAAEVPFKCTAGLHHPFRHDSATVKNTVIPAKAGIHSDTVIPAKAGIHSDAVIPAKAGIHSGTVPTPSAGPLWNPLPPGEGRVRASHREMGAGPSVKEHGFINIFLAAALAMTGRVNEQELEAILADDDPSHFTFRKNAIAWKSQSVPIDDIEKCRDEFAVSYGSCSFVEPLEDLRSLGLL